jgi:hypothetical protein
MSETATSNDADHHSSADERISATVSAIAALKKDLAAYDEQQSAPRKKLVDALERAEAEKQAVEAAKRHEAARELALVLQQRLERFVAEADDFVSALSDVADSGSNLKECLVDIHALQQQISTDTPMFPSMIQLSVMVDRGFRSALMGGDFAHLVERLSSVERVDLAAVVRGYKQRITNGWITPYVDAPPTNGEAA